MTFERTDDAELIGAVMRHPRLYGWMSDDFSPERERFKPTIHPLIWYVLVRDGKQPLGLFMFTPHSEILWEVHTILLPTAWGDRAAIASREMATWIWANTPCQRIITNVPQYNRMALRFARKAGMSQFGVNDKSFMKNGKLWDQIMLGLNRPAEG